jgi:hypothetical protein
MIGSVEWSTAAIERRASLPSEPVIPSAARDLAREWPESGEHDPSLRSG